jgi:hypothetical protein
MCSTVGAQASKNKNETITSRAKRIVTSFHADYTGV